MAATEFDFFKWQQEFDRLAHESAFARSSLNNLLKAGCDRESLALGLVVSCDFKGAPGTEILRDWRFQARQSANRLLLMASRLELDRKRVVEITEA